MQIKRLLRNLTGIHKTHTISNIIILRTLKKYL